MMFCANQAGTFAFVVVTLFCSTVLIGCDESLAVRRDVAVPFSIFGVLSPDLEVQSIRVYPHEALPTLGSPEPLDADVFSTDLETGARVAWRDSVLVEPNGQYDHVARTDETIFSAEIIDRVDFFAGGFGASYGGRLSSVIDVSARPGNNRRFAGSISASPFTGAMRVEGPIVPRHASFLVSARKSIIHHVDESLYGKTIPFEFGDVFAKLSAMPSPTNRLEATAFRSNDRGTLVAEVGDDVAQQLRWKNSGASLTWLLLPQSFPVAAELTLSRSQHEMQQGAPTDTVRMTSVRSTRIALDATFAEGSLFGGRSTTLAGWEVVIGRTDNELGGLFQNVEDRGIGITTFGVFVEPQLNVNGITLQPGLRMQTYNVRHLPYLEPRLRVTWESGIHHVSGALGFYNQHLVGLTDRRDAASVFTAWSGVPRVNDRPPRTKQVQQVAPRTWEVTIPPNLPLESIGGELIRGRLGTSVHALVGYRSSPTNWLEYGIESFYKRSTNLFVGELTALSRLTTRLLPATGRSVGLEARVELRRHPLYAFMTYGLSSTVYEADGRAVSTAYDVNGVRYRPPHDRRHQINVLRTGWNSPVSGCAIGLDTS